MSIWAYAIHWAMFKVHFESTAWCIVTHKLSCSTEVKTCLRKVDHDGGPEHEMRTVTRYLEIHCIWFHVPLKKKNRGHSWSFVVWDAACSACSACWVRTLQAEFFQTVQPFGQTMTQAREQNWNLMIQYDTAWTYNTWYIDIHDMGSQINPYTMDINGHDTSGREFQLDPVEVMMVMHWEVDWSRRSFEHTSRPSGHTMTC